MNDDSETKKIYSVFLSKLEVDVLLDMLVISSTNNASTVFKSKVEKHFESIKYSIRRAIKEERDGGTWECSGDDNDDDLEAQIAILESKQKKLMGGR